MTSDQSYDALFDGTGPLRGNEDPDEGVLVWSRTSALTPLVCTLVRLHGPTAALGFVETEDLDRLHKRADLLRTLLQFKQFLTTDELAVRAEAFVRFLEQNRESLLATGYPDARFTTWPAPLAVNLYPVRFSQNLFDDALAPQPQLGAGTAFVVPRPPLQWCCPTTTGPQLQTVLSRWLQAVPCRYDEAPLIDVRDSEDVERLEAGRPALLDLKIRLLERLAQALVRGSAVSLWDDCLSLLTDALLGSEADFYLTVDHRRGSELRQTGHLGRSNWAELLPGGLTELFEVIGYVEKELTIGTMDRTKRELDRVVDPDEQNPYLSAIGTTRQDQIDAALEGFEDRNIQEVAFWRSYQERVNEALQCKFRSEILISEPIARHLAAKFEPWLHSLVAWSRHHLEQTGELPDLQLSQPTWIASEPDNVFRREGDTWTIRYAGTTIHLQDSMGLHYLAHLLEHPGEEIHVLILDAAVRGHHAALEGSLPSLSEEDLGQLTIRPTRLDDLGSIIDPKTRTTVKARLKELEPELALAHEVGDDDTVERIQDEIEQLGSFLAASLGLGDRARKAGSVAEKARVNVRRNIARTLKKISTQHPDLDAHLRAVKTGHFCVYSPTPNDSVTWTF